MRVAQYALTFLLGPSGAHIKLIERRRTVGFFRIPGIMGHERNLQILVLYPHLARFDFRELQVLPMSRQTIKGRECNTL